MKLFIISGRSGSGKSTALNALEDLGYYCIDNLPVDLLKALVEQAQKSPSPERQNMAVSIDARNLPGGLGDLPVLLQDIRNMGVHCEVIYLDADESILLQRFSATRRRHPLTNGRISLQEAIQEERRLLRPISNCADLTIDTTHMTLYDLRDTIKVRVAGRAQELAVLFLSFGFKHGLPLDADLVFDVRCLPNPHWIPSLRGFTGREQPVIDYLQNEADVGKMLDDLRNLLETWLPYYERNNRAYMTVAIGCTGGQHRSVYMVEQLAAYFTATRHHIQTRHRELD
ncbi:glmZ(sRNA)-inactivating NTPase [Pokkaliibacter plantistimulans]|uniref:GlmZ(SRNA)-inactivating NTPase n=2 Tax=Pseudomonadota TaxID=1224 RepID=A0ABX5LYF3_9GAMM|nr:MULTISPECIES: RNase adapter RapZ [Pokkaliibacter]MDH2431668.1 RNase adapter RapZ [Pokkaliibacter sp. MBI-7]PPC74769.1 RNase adapter RapZ [Pokkaliibacter plantistimulans]PXF31722.1 glmZ(sRNA)-inactivating NTPase [Pokkaliibacter plantistimulans]